MLVVPKLKQTNYHLNGKEFDLTTDNMSITSTNFSVDKDGNMECNNAKVRGTINSTDGNIGGWNITEKGLTNGKTGINSDGSSTIYTVADLIVIRGYIMGYPGFELSPGMIQHYDFNGDGRVSAVDYAKLQKLIGISME